MQSFSVYGLIMDYENNNDKYIYLKTILENIGRNIEAIQSRNPMDCCHFVKIDDFEKLSICVWNNHIEFGIINTKSNSIAQHLTANYIDKIRLDMCSSLNVRMENLYNNFNKDSIPHSESMEKLWQSYLREKYNDNTITFPNNTQLVLKENVDNERE